MPEPDGPGSGDQPKVLRDPVHNLIAIPGEDRKLILGLLDRPEFQRLRRIRQLGVSLLIYPGAEHSRWAHSLGVQHVARRMLNTLRKRYRGRSEFKDALDELQQHRREILVAALLHDVGHGPFSHVFEKALPKVKDAPEGYPKDHEEWSERIIKECFAEYLTKNGVSVDVVAGLINKKNRKNLLAKDFISSQLDADRMDYLLRDSHATGAKYGEFDLEWLLHTLRIGKVAVRGEQEGRWRLCLDGEKATHAVEEYIQAREFMYVQVYIHKTSRAYEAMLRHILALAARICDADPDKAPQPCPPALAKMLACKAVTTQEYLSLDDFRLWTTFMDWTELDPGDNLHRKALRDKCRRLVHRGRPYRFIELDNRERQDKALELVTDLKTTEQEFSCYRDAFTDVAYRNVFYRKSREEEEQEDRAIFFIEPDGHTQPAEARSDVIRAISEIETKIYRLYYDDQDPEMMKRLSEDGWL
ncbi:MAG: HD domain-containing protein [Planctomycetes bacterium]|nr:HD domain-containing protein [Planctomycetota bacterium]